MATPLTSEAGKAEWAKFKVFDGSTGGEAANKKSKKKTSTNKKTSKASKSKETSAEQAPVFKGTYSTIYKCTSSAAPKASLSK